MRALVAILAALLLAGCAGGMYGINVSYNHKTGEASAGVTWSPGVPAQPDNPRAETEERNAAPPLPDTGRREGHGSTSP